MLRFEYKYYVPNRKLDLLRSMIKPFAVLDKFADSKPKKEYTVRSIYFDTPDFECYATKVDGLKHRNKVRLRGYDLESPENTVFCEIKRKYEGPILKTRAPVSFLDVKKIFKGESTERYVENTKKFPSAKDDAKRFMYNVYARKMRPVVCVIYEREPWLSKLEDFENNLRITFDKNLRGTAYPSVDDLYDEEGVQLALQGYFILEVKFNEYCPSWVKPIIGTLGLHKEPASKYCLCIDAHNQINPSSRFDTYSYGRLFNPRKN